MARVSAVNEMTISRITPPASVRPMRTLTTDAVRGSQVSANGVTTRTSGSNWVNRTTSTPTKIVEPDRRRNGAEKKQPRPADDQAQSAYQQPGSRHQFGYRIRHGGDHSRYWPWPRPEPRERGRCLSKSDRSEVHCAVWRCGDPPQSRYCRVDRPAGCGRLVRPRESAWAGGPTSVLLANPQTGRVAALYYTDKAYDRLAGAVGAFVSETGSTNRPGAVTDDFTGEIRLTWLIHDMSIWRIDRIHATTEDGMWVQTVVRADGGDVFDQPGTGSGPSTPRPSPPRCRTLVSWPRLQ